MIPVKMMLAILILALPLVARAAEPYTEDDSVWNSMVEHLLGSGPDSVARSEQGGYGYTVTKVYPDRTFSLRRNGAVRDVCQVTATRSWCNDFATGRRHDVFELRNGKWVGVDE
jgi:hypothetical protein